MALAISRADEAAKSKTIGGWRGTLQVPVSKFRLAKFLIPFPSKAIKASHHVHSRQLQPRRGKTTGLGVSIIMGKKSRLPKTKLECIIGIIYLHCYKGYQSVATFV